MASDLDQLVIEINEKVNQLKKIYGGRTIDNILTKHIEKVNNTLKAKVGSRVINVWNKKKHRYRSFSMSDWVQQYINNRANRRNRRVGLVYLNFVLRFQQKGINQYVTYNRERRYKDKTVRDVVTRRHRVAKKVYLTTQDCQNYYNDFINDLTQALRL